MQVLQDQKKVEDDEEKKLPFRYSEGQGGVWTIWGVAGAFCVSIWASRLSMRTWLKALNAVLSGWDLNLWQWRPQSPRCLFPDSCFQTFLNSLLGSPSALPGQYWLFHRAPTEPCPGFYRKRVRATRPQLISQGRPWRVWTQSHLPSGSVSKGWGQDHLRLRSTGWALCRSSLHQPLHTWLFWKMKNIQYLLFLFCRKFMYIRGKWNISISNKKNLDDPPFHPLEIVLTAYNPTQMFFHISCFPYKIESSCRYCSVLALFT